jgi:hypothetical protein
MASRKDDPRTREPGEGPKSDESTRLIPDLMRRAIGMGFTGVFMTEEAIRRALGDTVPKDWIDFAVDQSDSIRTEFVNRLAGEMARTLETLDLDGMLKRVLENHSFQVSAEIRLVPDADKETGGKPSGTGRKGGT